MKKFSTITLCIVFALFCNTSFSQHFEPHFSSKGSSFVSLGVGLFPTFFKDGAQVVIPPSSLSYEKKITDIFSIGLTTGYSRSLSKWLIPQNAETKRYRHDAYFAGLRAAAHCVTLEKWDFYGGAVLSFHYSRIQPEKGAFGPEEAFLGINPRTNQFVWNAFIGAKFSCCNRLMFFGEASYGISILTLGIGFKL